MRGKLVRLLVALVSLGLIPVGFMLSIAGIFDANGFLVLAGFLLTLASAVVFGVLASLFLIDAFSWLADKLFGPHRGDDDVI